MIKLTEEAIQIIRDDTALFIKLQIMFDCTERTMYNYLNHNSEELTKIDCLNVLVIHTNRRLSDLIVGGKIHKLVCK